MFEDRTDAGRQLGHQLKELNGLQDVLVLALPRGGVAVGFEVARELKAPLDIVVVRKLATPDNEELAMGAIASGGALVINEQLLRHLAIDREIFDATVRRESAELARRESLYRRDRQAHPIADKTVILVDDGLATGATMRAALVSVRQARPRKVVVAAPVAAPDTARAFRSMADEVVTCATPLPLGSVSHWYKEFPQLSDTEVQCLLDAAERTWSAV